MTQFRLPDDFPVSPKPPIFDPLPTEPHWPDVEAPQTIPFALAHVYLFPPSNSLRWLSDPSNLRKRSLSACTLTKHSYPVPDGSTRYEWADGSALIHSARSYSSGIHRHRLHVARAALLTNRQHWAPPHEMHDPQLPVEFQFLFKHPLFTDDDFYPPAGAPFIDYVKDDGGAAAENMPPEALNCQLRAIAILLDLPYSHVHRIAKGIHASQGYQVNGEDLPEYQHRFLDGTLNRAFTQGLISTAFGLVAVRLPFGDDYGSDKRVEPTYSEAHKHYGNCIVGTRLDDGTGHAAAIVDGALRDTFDSRVSNMENFLRHGTGQRRAHAVLVPKAQTRHTRQSHAPSPVPTTDLFE